MVFIACSSLSALAQQPGSTSEAQPATAEQRVPLAEKAVAFDAMGRAALAGGLLTTTLGGSNDAPVRNVRLVIENRSAEFYTYISGWATFYDAAGVRCGAGLFKVDALASQESAETDTPGLRLTCAPATWRIVALNLLTRVGDTARPVLQQSDKSANPTTTVETQRMTYQKQVTDLSGNPINTPADQAQPATSQPDMMPLFVNVSVDGRTYRVPLGGTLEIPVNKKRTRITVSASPQ
jgi:hypothetical protein